MDNLQLKSISRTERNEDETMADGEGKFKDGEDKMHIEERQASIPCFVGLLRKMECHAQSVHCRGPSVCTLVCEMSHDEQKLLSRRTNLEFNETSTICSHHKAIFLTKYDLLQKACCNPFSKANHVSKKSLRVIDIEIADQVKAITKQDIKPGQKLCPRCLTDLAAALQSKEQSASDTDIDDKMDTSEKLNTCLACLGVSPIKFSAVSQRDSQRYAKRKVSEVHSALITKIAQSGDLDQKVLTSCETCHDYEELINELKAKLHSSSHAQKVQILTLAPNSWSRERVVEVFGVTDYMVRQARELKKRGGVLATPLPIVGKKLCEGVMSRVLAFYEDDQFSRLCPGKKDFVSVRIEGQKVHKQKRLLLCNLKELFIAYRASNGSEIGFSKFCDLRPKWCITVGSAGTHSVCVCTMHQNVKLMLLSGPVQLDYKALMAKTVCDVECKDCMLHRCDECPGKQGIAEYLTNLIEDLDPEELISFKQWVHTDRDTIEVRQLPLEEFVLELANKIFSLTIHHYIAKHQSLYLKTSKEELTSSKLIVLMDFAENYSFIVQDAVQGFHWENSQATLHPFVVYYRSPGQKVESLSFCAISDCVKHDTVAVHVFLSKLLFQLKGMFPELKQIQYFSDGSAAQYKNYKNFVNLCHHERDFGFSAEWNFFATSHGKSPCDGIGGTTKRLAAYASLQRPLDGQIITVADLFNFCDKSILGIKFMFVSKDEIESIRPMQEDRFSKGQTVAGTRENHQFKPVSPSSIRVSRVSGEAASFLASLYEDTVKSTGLKVSQLQPGQYVACIYDNSWWTGNICELSLQEHDALVDFMHPHGPSTSFCWPSRKDRCWVPEQHIIAILPTPTTSSTGRLYSYPHVITCSVDEIFKSMKQ